MEGIDIRSLQQLIKQDQGKLLSILISFTNSFDRAEDALQDAFVSALKSWPVDGEPNNKQAWLLRVARNRAIDRLRQLTRENSGNYSLNHSLANEPPFDRTVELDEPNEIGDERLKLIFTCCHPAIPEEHRVALTLKTLCGLSVKEIARAFMVPETSMQKRLQRAKQKIQQKGIAYEVPEQKDLHYRLPSVLAVVYLIYNESYVAYEGVNLSRQDLADEAIRLGRLVFNMLPEPSAGGLLALLLLHNARRNARTERNKRFIPLEKQDRSLWDYNEIKEARALLILVLSEGQPDIYQVQAAISAVHSHADSWCKTDWQQIIMLYDKLYSLNPSPVVKLNQIVAISQSGKLMQAQNMLAQIEDELLHYQPFYAAKADLMLKLNNRPLAVECYKQAIALSKNVIEKDYLMSQLKGLTKHEGHG